MSKPPRVQIAARRGGIRIGGAGAREGAPGVKLTSALATRHLRAHHALSFAFGWAPPLHRFGCCGGALRVTGALPDAMLLASLLLTVLLPASSVAMRPLPRGKHVDVAIGPRPKLGGRLRSAASFAVSATSVAAVSLFAMAPPAAAVVKVATRAASKMPWILPTEPLSAIVTVILTTFTVVFSSLSWVLSIKFKSVEDKIDSKIEGVQDKITSLENFVKVQAQETKDCLRLAAQATMNPARAHLMYADQRSTDEVIGDPANAPLASMWNPAPNTTV